MDLVRRATIMRELSREARSKGRKLSFVPTMGALHDGHLSLVRRAKELGDLTVVSVFVNPRQFGPSEDYASYPRELTRDADLCIQEGVDLLFAPEAGEMYPEGFRTHVEVEGLSDVLEGASRPGHFRGVCTVVLKLLNLVRPHFAFFGQKDAQQALVVRRMVRDLNLDTELVICPTVRQDDGLALSSRNAYLSVEERQAAAVLHRALDAGRRAIEEEGERDPHAIERCLRDVLAGEPRARVDYAVVVDGETLQPLQQLDRPVALMLAVWIGSTRLIDNQFARPTGAATPLGEVR